MGVGCIVQRSSVHIPRRVCRSIPGGPGRAHRRDGRRLRAMDNRIRSLVKANDSLRSKSSRGVGGAETPEASAVNRLDKLLDLKFDRMKKDLLVDVNDLDIIGETLDGRRLPLESGR